MTGMNDPLGIESIRDAFAAVATKVKLVKVAGVQVDYGRFAGFVDALCSMPIDEVREEIVQPERARHG